MRIGIVNDLPIAVEVMRRTLIASAKHEVAWTASDGAEAVAMCQRDRPDLVLMDLLMPEVDGVEATRRIMATSPCPILIVTATIEGNCGKVFEAMGAGALDVVQTPTLGGSGAAQGAAGFFYKIDAISRILGEPPPKAVPEPPVRERARRLVAIGASAGGPAALVNLLSGLPADFEPGIVIVQHVDAQFAAGLATWLNDSSRLPVRLAREGDIISTGTVYLAGTNDHLVLQPSGQLAYTEDPRGLSYRPSVNVFFESVVRYFRGKICGVLLTGMGRDGATGLKLLRDAGHHTIAQDAETSAVYGMPKAAAELSAAVEILPLGKIAPTLIARMRANVL